MKMRRRGTPAWPWGAALAAGAAAILLFSVVSACGGSDEAGGPEPPGGEYDASATLPVAISFDPGVLDPRVNVSIQFQSISLEMFDGLLQYSYKDPSDEVSIEPNLAERWEVSPDGKTYTFFLRRDVEFHDGTPFNAQAVEFSWRTVSDESFEYYYPQGAAIAAQDLAEVESFRAVDDYTFEVNLKRPWAQLIDRLGYGMELQIVSPDAIREYGNEGFGKNPVGTGPFRFVEYVAGQRLVLERNDDYWRGPAGAQQIIFRILPDEAARIGALEGNEVLIAQDLSVGIRERWEDRNDLELKVMPQQRVWTCWLNARSGPTANKAFREALSLATDREGMNQAIYDGLSTPARTQVAPGSPAYSDALPEPEFDLEQAKQKLAEAGYADGAKLVFVATTNPLHEAVMSVLRENLSDVGIDLEVQALEIGAFLDPFLKGLSDDQNGICVNAGEDDVAFLVKLFSEVSWPPGGYNSSWFSDPEFEALIAEADQAGSFDEYAAAMAEASVELTREYAALWKVVDPRVFGIASNVTWEPAPTLLQTLYNAKVMGE